MGSDHILGEKKGPLFHITYNRPEKRNAIHFDMMIELSEMVEAQITDPEVRVIILKGTGPVFSAGISSIIALSFIQGSVFGAAPLAVETLKEWDARVGAQIIGVPDPCRGETVKAFIVNKSGQTLTEKEVLDYCREELPLIRFRKWWNLWMTFPRVSSGRCCAGN